MKVSILEHVAKRHEEKAASLDPIGKKDEQELLTDLNSRATSINLQIIYIKRKNFLVFFLGNFKCRGVTLYLLFLYIKNKYK